MIPIVTCWNVIYCGRHSGTLQQNRDAILHFPSPQFPILHFMAVWPAPIPKTQTVKVSTLNSYTRPFLREIWIAYVWSFYVCNGCFVVHENGATIGL